MAFRPVLPAVPGIDLDFRPKTYFWPLSLEKHLLTRVKGAARRAELKKHLHHGRLGRAPEFLWKSSLSGAERLALGGRHPTFMGGEYLPDLAPEEVEIARITIASVTQDVTSVYARRGRSRITYRVVDDYGGETLSGRTTRTSSRTMSLGELEGFLNGAWSLFDVLAMNFADNGYELKRMLDFVVGVESAFYPQIGELYTERIKAWAFQRQADLSLLAGENPGLDQEADIPPRTDVDASPST